MIDQKSAFVSSLVFVLSLMSLTLSNFAMGSSATSNSVVSGPAPEKAIEIIHAWSRATPPGAPMGAVYMEFKNHSLEAISIDQISTDIAELSEVHQSIEIDGVMRMREVAPFIVPKNRTVALQPGGKHLMLIRLKQPLQTGSSFELSVTDSLGVVHQVPVKVGGYGQMSYPK